jgi:hypothetical protein
MPILYTFLRSDHESIASLESVIKKSSSFCLPLWLHAHAMTMRTKALIAEWLMSRYLEHGEEGEEPRDQATNSGVAGSSSTGELGWSRRGRVGTGEVASGARSLGLTIANLGHNGPGGSSLGLTIRDLRDNGPGGGDRPGCSRLRLAIRDLRDNGARGGTGGGSLGLSVGDLRDNCSWAGSLGLAVGDLGNTWGLGGLRLAIADLGNTTSRCYCDDVDRDTLCASALAVQVVEGTRQARVEDGWGSAAARRERKGTIAADGETSGFTSSSLEGVVELEPMKMLVRCLAESLVALLVVRCDVSLTTGLILEHAIIELQCQGTRKLARLKTTLSSAGSNIDGLDVEGSSTGSRAARRGRLSQSCSSQGEDGEPLHFQKMD